MQSSESIKQFLDSESIAYQEIPHTKNTPLTLVCDELGLAAENIVRAVPFIKHESKHRSDCFITLVPVNHILDIEQLQSKLALDVKPVVASFELIEEPALFPFGKNAESTIIMDISLQSVDEFYFPIDSEHTLIKISKDQFLLLSQSSQVLEFAVPLTDVMDRNFDDGLNFNKKRIISKIDDIEGLPAMPEMGYRILQISRDPNAGAKDLAKVIEIDPSLSAQIMSYSTSAFYGYPGEIDSVRDAIARVLGFELVANLALGIAVGKEFKIKSDGPLGLNNFWRHAVYSSALAEKLAKSLLRTKGMKPGLAYLCGLLHNFGHLLIGHIYAPGFETLNRSISANPDIDLKVLELFNLGVTHEEIGANLLEKWKMPIETIRTARWHHDNNCNEEASDYVCLIQLVDNLLNRYGIGDANSGILPPQALMSLGLSEENVLSSTRSLLESCAELDNIANKLSS